MNDRIALDDKSLIASLRDLYLSELQRAGDVRHASVVPVLTRPRRGPVAIASSLAAAVVVLALVAGLTVVAPPRTDNGSASPSPTLSSGSPAMGPLMGGIPTTVGGQPVLRGEAIQERIRTSKDSTPYLVGGWFHRGEPERFCPAFLTGTPWWFCSAFALYDQPKGGSITWIYPGHPAGIAKDAPIAANRPVVLLIRTHDPSCATHPAPTDCATLPVVVRLVWSGPAE
jgi:hypothetical protein